MRATIIIPTFGRPAALERAVGSLLASTEHGTEIIVVDNNSDDAISAEVRAACGRAGDRVRWIPERAPGLTSARHRGALEARGEVLVYIDDDVVVSAGWLAALLRAFEEDGAGLAGGPSIPLFTSSIPAWLWSFVQPTPHGGWHCGWLSLIDMGRDTESVDPIWIWGLNFAIRRDILFDLGGFHPDTVPPTLQRWQGDGETGLGIKARERGVPSRHVHGALVQHVIGPDRLTIDYFVKRAYFQGVCDSFTAIRSGVPPSDSEKGPRSMPSPDANAEKWASAAYEVRCRTVAAYNEGWLFHQHEIVRDPRLLDWVRRESYLNADIRDELRRP